VIKKETNHGFTLLEIVLVTTMIAVISVSGTLSLNYLQGLFKARAVSDEIRALLQQAREMSQSNTNYSSYKVVLNNNIFTLQNAASTEITRYQPPVGITLSPSAFTWSFSAGIGQVSGCTLPCQLTITSSKATETITIKNSGIIN